MKNSIPKRTDFSWRFYENGPEHNSDCIGERLRWKDQNAYRSFLLNARTASHNGIVIQSIIIPMVNRTPAPLPKKSL